MHHRRAALLSFTLVSVALVVVSTRTESAAPPDAPLRFVVLCGGNRAGKLETRTDPDGARVSHFEYTDRGRGPSIDERIVLGPQGRPARIEITGHDYFKNEVDERFSIEAGKATWKNSAEAGSADVRSPGIYVGIDGTLDELTILANALRAAPGRKLPLLPAGEGGIDEVSRLTLTAAGGSVEAVQYAVTGLGFAPQSIWLDADGRLLFQGTSYLAVVREGWEGETEKLLAAQAGYAAKRLGDAARRVRRVPAGPLVLRNGDLFDSVTGKVTPHATVVISGHRITAAGADGTVAIPPGAEVIDASGKTILPGLWDMHVHSQDDDGLLHLAAGVTSVRDLANDTDELLARRKHFDEGSLAGPRIVMAGILDGPGPFKGPTKVLVDDEAQARAAVDRYADLGYAQIKVYSSVKPELVPAIVKEGHARGLRVSGHVPAGMTAEEVVKDGFDEIQHANFLFLNFWPELAKETRSPVRFTAVAERAAGMDLASPPVREFVAFLKAKGTVLDPTLSIFETILTARKGTIDAGFAAVADRMPPQVRRGFLGGGLPVPEGMDATYRKSFDAMLGLVKVMYDAGVPIVAGTDSYAGFALHRELELYARAGIPAPEVLRIATLGGARVMKLDKDLGSVEAGKLADLILVDGRPAEKISDIRRVSLVVKDGVVFDPAAMYREVGVMAP